MRPLLVLSFALAACDIPDPDAAFGDLQASDTAAFDDPALLPADQLGVPPVITQFGTCPGVVTFSLSSMTPGGTYRLGRSPNLGPGTPITTGPCAGTALRIGPPTFLVSSGAVPPSGTHSLTFTLGPAACGQHIQVLDMASCTTSLPHTVF